MIVLGGGTEEAPFHRHQEDFDLGLFLLVCSISSAWIVNKNVHLFVPLGRGYSLLPSCMR